MKFSNNDTIAWSLQFTKKLDFTDQQTFFIITVNQYSM
ncbi:hypothetical protein Rmar_2139 [Rhodothermus marinus DSM 4252]|uniref:Uncharacterized protein n=1 Tax=Rhodothermus marinus (strain ATCC 43812 / DSM 4252 / R-10) TaxID=518766 RepID=D0MDA6_RHOM4|nr:hypothetical protein Rmar_2139 [Rhodothermus marinus DSM 4252]